MCFISNVKDSNLKILRKHTWLWEIYVYIKLDTDLETEIIIRTWKYTEQILGLEKKNEEKLIGLGKVIKNWH